MEANYRYFQKKPYSWNYPLRKFNLKVSKEQIVKANYLKTHIWPKVKIRMNSTLKRTEFKPNLDKKVAFGNRSKVDLFEI